MTALIIICAVFLACFIGMLFVYKNAMPYDEKWDKKSDNGFTVTRDKYFVLQVDEDQPSPLEAITEILEQQKK